MLAITRAQVQTAGRQVEIRPSVWIARLIESATRPQIAKVKQVYIDEDGKGNVLVDLVFFRHDGYMIGRVSRTVDGPKNYEPMCDFADGWQKIMPPDFERLSESNYEWGSKLKLCLI